MARSRSPRWYLDELRTAGRENLDPAHVERYDDKEDAGAEAEVALLRTVGLDADAVLVDLGAGTGQLVVAAAAHCARVVAVDVSPQMLAVLEAKLDRSRLKNVQVVRAGFTSYDHEGDRADIVYSRWALHHLPDFWKAQALVRMRAIVRPGGTLRLADLAFSFDPSEADERLGRWCASLPEHGAEGEWIRSDLEKHLRDEHSTYTWLLEPMIERAGFRIDDARYDADGVSAAYLATAI